MNYRKILILSLLLMLFLAPFVVASDGTYDIPEATEYITVNDDGSCLMSEEITYDIHGLVNGVYRDIPVDYRQSVTNISVETPGYYNDVEILRESKTSNDVRIKVWLYRDKEKTEKVEDESVRVIYNYTFNKGVKVYNDISEFQYMSWGKAWSSDVDTLKTYVSVPGSGSECEYWNNPDTYVTSSKWNSNVLETVAKGIPEHSTLEQRIIMPRSFIKSTENANVISKDAKDKIEADQKKYADDIFYQNTIPKIVLGIMGLLLVIPAGIYAFFGREPKIDYDSEYEYDLPTDSTPVEVNSLVVGDVGEVTVFGFNAVILDLINRKYFKIVRSDDGNTVIRAGEKSTDDLKDHELDVFNYLRKFEDDGGDISLKNIKDVESPDDHVAFIDEWKKKAKESVPDSLIRRYFDDRGVRIYKKLAIATVVIGIVSIIILAAGNWSMFFAGKEYLIYVWFFLPFVAIMEVVSLYAMENKKLGRWTREGREYYEKWKNFEKYIKDYSLINERPPESVQVWGKYLVYAAALGYAKAATSTMQEYFNNRAEVSSDYIAGNDTVWFTYHGGFSDIDSSFSSLREEYYAAHSSSGGDYGDIGSAGSGGFGGGGGGTF